MTTPLLIRADASVVIGTGHIMRMIALAQAWQDAGGLVVFLGAEITPALEARLEEEHFLLEKIHAVPGSREDLAATCAVIARYADASLPVVLDGYQFNADFQLGLKSAGCRLLVMDDYGHAEFYHADWVLNQNITATDDLYKHRAPQTKLLLGTRFALLRRDFLEHSTKERVIPTTARRLLVTLGGADPDNITEQVLAAIAGFDLEIKVVVGGSNPHLQSLRHWLEKISDQSTRVELILNAKDMPVLMQWADMAVAAGGSTALELAFMGLPAIFVTLAENQKEIVRALHAGGLGKKAGGTGEFSPMEFCDIVRSLVHDVDERRAFSVHGRKLVDGRGAVRVVERLANTDKITFRNVMEQDFTHLWKWANDLATRNNSFQSDAIPWDNHLAWCRTKVEKPDCFFWIAENQSGENIGCVRFDCLEDRATFSITIAPQARGKGYASRVISRAVEEFSLKQPMTRIEALIKPENVPSIRAFEAAGFSPVSDIEYIGQSAKLYAYARQTDR